MKETSSSYFSNDAQSDGRCGSAFGGKTTKSSMVWSILVVIAFIIQVLANIIGSAGTFNNETNAEISSRNPTFLTPDGLTFAVWGIIYTFQAIFTLYQVIPQVQNSYGPLNASSRIWAVILFILNAIWLPVFGYELWWLSFFVIACMYLALIMLYIRLEIHYGLGGSKTICSDIMPALFNSSGTEAEKPTEKNVYWFHKVFIFVGFSTNMAWLSFAVVLNFIIALRNSGWSTSAGPDSIAVGGNPDFAVMAIVLVSMLASYLALKFGDIPFALVVMWALGGINRMQTVNNPSRFPVELQSQEVAQWSIAMLIYMGVISGISLLRIILQTKNSCCYGKCFRAEHDSIQKLINGDDEENASISGENLI